VPIVELLLKVHGINPNFEGGRLQAAPLLLAADEGHIAIVELLPAVVNINPDVRDEDGFTPLISACYMGHVSIVQQLLSRTDVDFNCTDNYCGYGTPLITACHERHLEIINLLLAKDGIDINLVHGTTPLIEAAKWGLVEVVEILARDNTLNPNITDENGNYALGEAAFEGHIDVMKLLLVRPDVDPNFAGGFNGTTPLILGARFPDVVKLLLGQQGIDVNPQEHSAAFRTALMETARCNLVKSAKLLLERDDININIPNSEGWTSLHWACHEASLEVVNLDIDINAGTLIIGTPHWPLPVVMREAGAYLSYARFFLTAKRILTF
jgi:ankyrin repeat protein